MEDDKYSDQLLAEKDSIFSDHIIEILLGYSEKDLSHFGVVFNSYRGNFSGVEKKERTQWKVDKKLMAREMADYLEKNKLESPLYFHLIKDFYPKKILRCSSVEKIENYFLSYLIAFQVASLIKKWSKIKYPGFPMVPTLNFFTWWIESGGVLEKLKVEVKEFKLTKRGKEFFGFLKESNADVSKQDQKGMLKAAFDAFPKTGVKLEHYKEFYLQVGGIAPKRGKRKRLDDQKILEYHQSIINSLKKANKPLTPEDKKLAVEKVQKEFSMASFESTRKYLTRYKAPYLPYIS